MYSENDVKQNSHISCWCCHNDFGSSVAIIKNHNCTYTSSVQRFLSKPHAIFAKHGSDFSEKHAFFKLFLLCFVELHQCWLISSSDESVQKLFKLCHVSQ